MSFTDNQRKAIVNERGEPSLRLEFDVFKDNHVSMWTNFDHSADFEKTRAQLVSIKDHLEQFIKDHNMCPFH